MSKWVLLLVLVGLVLAPADGLARRVDLHPSQDAYVTSGDPGGNYGTSNVLYVCGGYPGYVDTMRSYLKFDLSFLPVGATIQVAYLYLYDQTSDYAYEGSIYRVTESWTEGTITWSNKPAWDGTEIAEVEEPDPSPRMYCDLTGLAQGWQAGTYSNHGILIKYAYEDYVYEKREFRSGEYAGYEPMLVVVYDASEESVQPTKDSFVSNQSPDVNYGTAEYLQIGGPGGSYRRSYLSFDLSGIPAGSTIEFARVLLYQYSGSGGGGHRMAAHRVTQSWNETAITWNNKPTHNGTVESYKGPVGCVGHNQWFDWEITDLASGWFAGTSTNNGLVIKYPDEIPQGANRTGSIRSREYATGSYRPRLEVYYSYVEPIDYVLDQSLTGVWKSDAAWGDIDGDDDLDVVICGESDAGLVTRTYENVAGTLALKQDLVGILGECSGDLAWGDYD
ncbi:MAG: DNRLRE domain-containing protein, partial [Candidatus Eisenbacteria bacterium]